MSVYCISDIHGHFDKLIHMLNLIDFQESDELYVLGDIIDRGLQSAEMLWWATKEAPANVHFLMGNHEDMMLVGSSPGNVLTMRLGDSWAYNYGMETVKQVRAYKHYYPEWEKEILDWAKALPFFYDINVRGKRFVLVHAGLQSKYLDPLEGCTLRGDQYPLIAIEDCPLQNRQAMLWNRGYWIFDSYEWPFDVVCGHTYLHNVDIDFLERRGFLVEQEFKSGIIHINRRKHFIDCGVNHDGYLGCLRLDDMQEFYV